MKSRPALALFLVFAFSLFCSIPAVRAEGEVPPDRDTIIVGGNSAYPPYEFIDRDGKPAGFVVELTRAIAEVMEFNVEIRLGESWTDMRHSLEAGQINILQGISYSRDRERVLDFSPPHSYVSHSIFARNGAPSVQSLAELRGKEVILLGRGVMHDYFVQTGFEIQPFPVPTVAEALRFLETGRLDYAVLATLPASYLMKELGVRNIHISAKGIETKKYCYAVRKGDYRTLARFNEGLLLLKRSGRYEQLQNKWLGVLEPQPVPIRDLITYGLIIATPLLLGLAVSVAWSRALKKQVAVRTADLEREVEERKRAAEELQRQQQQLVQADKMAALGILVSGVAHEINNPTGMILLNMPVISETMRDIQPILESHYTRHGDFMTGGLRYSRMRQEIPHLLDEIQEGARRIKRIVEDLKHYSRRSDATIEEYVDINSVVRTSLRLLETTIRAATKHQKTHLHPNLPKVRGNSQRLEQVIVNLVLNACQALESPERGLFITTNYDRGTDTVSVHVCDEGVGIQPEHLARLTDPFFTTKRDTGGTGLGLAISAGIVKEHGGTLHFDSVPGEGSTAVVRLPAALPEGMA